MRSGRRDETGEAAEMLGASAAVPKVSTACTMLGTPGRGALCSWTPHRQHGRYYAEGPLGAFER